jgi:hypothetical protein
MEITFLMKAHQDKQQSMPSLCDACRLYRSAAVQFNSWS